MVGGSVEVSLPMSLFSAPASLPREGAYFPPLVQLLSTCTPSVSVPAHWLSLCCSQWETQAGNGDREGNGTGTFILPVPSLKSPPVWLSLNWSSRLSHANLLHSTLTFGVQVTTP